MTSKAPSQKDKVAESITVTGNVTHTATASFRSKKLKQGPVIQTNINSKSSDKVELTNSSAKVTADVKKNTNKDSKSSLEEGLKSTKTAVSGNNLNQKNSTVVKKTVQAAELQKKHNQLK